MTLPLGQMRITPHVLHAIDDLANEIFLRLQRELGDPAIDDSQGSLCMMLLEIEKDCAAINASKPAEKRSKTLSKSEQAIEQALHMLTPDQRDALFLHLGKGDDVPGDRTANRCSARCSAERSRPSLCSGPAGVG